MLKFKRDFNNRLQIEILFVKGLNDKEDEIRELNNFLIKLKPDIIDLNTVDRPPAYDVKPLSFDELFKISMMFDKSLNINIATRNRDINQKFNYSKIEIVETLKRRPLKAEDIELLFDIESKIRVDKLLEEKRIELNRGFYQIKE